MKPGIQFVRNIEINRVDCNKISGTNLKCFLICWSLARDVDAEKHFISSSIPDLIFIIDFSLVSKAVENKW